MSTHFLTYRAMPTLHAGLVIKGRMIKIGVSQIKNSVIFSDNVKAIKKSLSTFSNSDSDNKLFAQGDFESESCYLITIDENEIKKWEKLGPAVP